MCLPLYTLISFCSSLFVANGLYYAKAVQKVLIIYQYFLNFSTHRAAIGTTAVTL